MRKLRYYILALLISLVVAAILVVKLLLPPWWFRKIVLNPIPASVRVIGTDQSLGVNGHKYVLRFDINKADLSLILNSKGFKEIAYFEYDGGLLTYGESQNVTRGFHLYETYRGESAPRWFKLGDWDSFKPYLVEREKPGFDRMCLLLYDEERGEAYFIEHESRGPGVGPTWEEWQQGKAADAHENGK